MLLWRGVIHVKGTRKNYIWQRITEIFCKGNGRSCSMGLSTRWYFPVSSIKSRFQFLFEVDIMVEEEWQVDFQVVMNEMRNWYRCKFSAKVMGGGRVTQLVI